MSFFRQLLDSTIANIEYLGYWAYPSLFGLNILAAFLTLFVFRSRREPIVVQFRGRTFLRIDDARLSSPFWVCLRKRGAFLAVLVTAFLTNPVFAALMIRFLQISERRAYAYAISCILIETSVRVTIILYMSQTLRQALGEITAVTG